MANQEHVDILKQGVEAWNRWREKYNVDEIDLSGADLGGSPISLHLLRADVQDEIIFGTNLQRIDLRDVKLSGANLSGADLSFADLGQADFSQADLRYVHFNEADLEGANL